MADANQPDVSKMSFEDALAELEQIVRALEGGQQKLEDAITAYERGAALRKHCEAKLAEAEARVAAIVVRSSTSLSASVQAEPSLRVYENLRAESSAASTLCNSAFTSATLFSFGMA